MPLNASPWDGHISYGPCALLQAGRSGSFTVGVQMEPHSTLNLNDLQSFSLPQLWDDCRNSLSYCLAYSPAGESPYGGYTARVPG